MPIKLQVFSSLQRHTTILFLLQPIHLEMKAIHLEMKEICMQSLVPIKLQVFSSLQRHTTILFLLQPIHLEMKEICSLKSASLLRSGNETIQNFIWAPILIRGLSPSSSIAEDFTQI